MSAGAVISKPSAGAVFTPPVPVPNPKGLLALTWRDKLSAVAGMASNPIRTLSAYQFTLPVFQYSLFGSHFTVVNDPDMIRHCFVTNAGNYRLEPIRQAILTPALRDGMIAVEGDVWKRARRVCAPIFTPAYTESLAERMRVSVEARMEALFVSGEQAPVADLMSALAYGILSETLFSGEIDRDSEAMMADVSDFFTLLGNVDPLDMMRAPGWVPRPTRLRGKSAVRRLRARIRALIEDRRRRAEAGKALPEDFLTRLIRAIGDEAVPLSVEEIEDHILTFIAAGHETTARGLAWVLYLLSQDPVARSRAEAEIDALDPDRPAAETVGALPFTLACFEESMRLYPPAPFITRMAAEDDRFGLAFVPAGGFLFLNLYALHRHETLWDDPASFRPERFLGAARQEIGRFQYLPFGVGHRVCIGARFAMQEAMIILAALLRRYRFDYAGDRAPEPVMRITLKPDNGMPMVIKAR